MNLPDDLIAVQEAWKGCELCALHEIRTSVIYGSWAGDCDIPNPTMMFVVDRMDVQTLSRAVVPSGGHKSVLEFLLKKMNLRLSNFWVTPITLCPTTVHDPKEWPPLEIVPLPKVGQFGACRPRLHREILVLNPEIIVALGPTAAKALWSKNPPKFQPGLGSTHELKIMGELVTRTFPVMFTHSLNALYRDENLSSGGNWNQAYNAIQMAYNIGTHLDTLRGGN